MNNVVSFSGGKDSTAMLLMMLEKRESIHSAVFFDTGWEFPQMIEHIDKVEEYTGINIVRLSPARSFNYWMYECKVKARKQGLVKLSHQELSYKWDFVKENYEPDLGSKPSDKNELINGLAGRIHRIGNGWPSPMRRWCTRVKVYSINKYLSSVENPVSCIGYAADEAHRSDSKNIVDAIAKGKQIRFPLIEWDMDEKQALEYCGKHGFDWGGLYRHFRRVSCFCCPLQRLGELKTLRKHYPDLWAKMLEWDKKVPDRNRGFYDYKTVHHLESKFRYEESMLTWMNSNKHIKE